MTMSMPILLALMQTACRMAFLWTGGLGVGFSERVSLMKP